MWSWTITIVLYLLGMTVFHLLGGIGAAGEAFRRWGEATGKKHARRTTPTSS